MESVSAWAGGTIWSNRVSFLLSCYTMYFKHSWPTLACDLRCESWISRRQCTHEMKMAHYVSVGGNQLCCHLADPKHPTRQRETAQPPLLPSFEHALAPHHMALHQNCRCIALFFWISDLFLCEEGGGNAHRVRSINLSTRPLSQPQLPATPLLFFRGGHGRKHHISKHLYPV